MELIVVHQPWKQHPVFGGKRSFQLVNPAKLISQNRINDDNEKVPLWEHVGYAF